MDKTVASNEFNELPGLAFNAQGRRIRSGSGALGRPRAAWAGAVSAWGACGSEGSAWGRFLFIAVSAIQFDKPWLRVVGIDKFLDVAQRSVDGPCTRPHDFLNRIVHGLQLLMRRIQKFFELAEGLFHSAERIPYLLRALLYGERLKAHRKGAKEGRKSRRPHRRDLIFVAEFLKQRGVLRHLGV